MANGFGLWILNFDIISDLVLRIYLVGFPSVNVTVSGSEYAFSN